MPERLALLEPLEPRLLLNGNLEDALFADLEPERMGDITTGLVAHWDFNEGSGTTAADSSGNVGTDATTDELIVDTVAPTVASYTLAADTGVSDTDQITSDDAPVLTFTFSEPVYGDAGDVEVLDPGAGAVTPDSIVGWGTDTLTVTFTTPLTVLGEYAVTLNGTATIADDAGNPLNGGADEVVTFTADFFPSLGAERVSVASDDSQGNGESLGPALSADGRIVAFSSDAPNLVPGDTNAVRDIFVRDRTSGTTERISVASDGTQGNGESWYPAISADGRFVVFRSFASNLVPDDTNGVYDIFVHDRTTGETERVSVAADGSQADGEGRQRPAISADGRLVVFRSIASNLVPDDTNGHEDVFVYDREVGTVERVSVASDGTQGDGPTWSCAISGNGRFVAFTSSATNLIADDFNAEKDLFLHDRDTGQTQVVTMGYDGWQIGTGINLGSPSLSQDGRYLAYECQADNLVPGDTNGKRDIFVFDRELEATERVSIATSGTEANGNCGQCAISADGRFVVFYSSASNLVPGDTNGRNDIFLRDRANSSTIRVSLGPGGVGTNQESSSPAISGTGWDVAFQSDAYNLVPDDTNVDTDVFAVSWGRAVPVLVSYVLADDTGFSDSDRVTSDTTPQLTFTFSEPVSGDDADVTVLDPDTNPVVPDSIAGWGTDTLTVTFTTPLTVDGEYTITLDATATITDAAGNPLNAGVDEVVTFTVRHDMVPPTVTGLTPTPASYVDAAPGSVVATLSEGLDAATVTTGTFVLESSGGDGTFGDGDETVITPAAVSMTAADEATLDLTGVALTDDTYRVTLVGTGASPVTDLEGNALDGEYAGAFPSGDGTAGGDFAATFVIDTADPVVTVDPLTTNDPTPGLTGTVSELGATVEVTVDGTAYAATNNGDGTWTLADDTISPALGEGTYEVAAVATDLAGNTGSDATTDELVVDPTAPKVTSVTPEHASTVFDELAAVVVTFDEAVDAATVTADSFVLIASGGDGTFGDGNETTVTPAGVSLTAADQATLDLTGVDLAEDTYQVKLLGTGGNAVRDAVGNDLDGEFSGAFPSGDDSAGGDFEATFFLDVCPLRVLATDLTEDTGRSDSDRVTSDTTPVLTFTFSLPVYGDDGDVSVVGPDANPVAPASITGWTTDTLTITLGTLTLNGEYTVTLDAAITDGGANQLNDGIDEVVAFTVDNVVPVVTVPDLAAASDTGQSNSDNVTQGVAPQFSGGAFDATAGMWKVVVESDDGKSATDDTSPYYGVTLPTLDEGTRTVSATATDVAGNTYTTPFLTVTVDRTAPGGTAPDLLAASDTGAFDDDDVTQGVAPQFSGTASGGSSGLWKVVVASDDGKSATTTDASYTVTLATLDEGGRTVTVTVYDVAGNTYVPTALGLTVDRTAPVVSVPDLAAASDTGNSDSDDITQGIDPQFDGTAIDDHSAVLQVVVESDDGKSATDDAAPFYSVTLATLDEGTRTVTATATDLAGNSVTTDPLTVEVNRSAPTVTGYALTEDTGQSDSDQLTNDTTPALTFTFSEPVYGAADDIVVLDPNSNPVTPDSISGWGTDTLIVAFTTPLAVDGEYQVTLDGSSTIEDTEGTPLNNGADEVVTFTLDTTVPVVTVDVLETNDTAPELTGTVDDTVATVEVTVDGTGYAATNNGDGTWTLADDAISPELADGTYDVAVTATDVAGNAGTDPTADELTIDTAAPTAAVYVLKTNDTTPPLFGTVDDPAAVVEVTVGGGTYTATNFGNGSWMLADNAIAPPLAEGTYDVAVTATDPAGNIGSDDSADELTIDTTPPGLTGWEVAGDIGGGVTTNATPTLTFTFTEAVYGTANDITVLDPNGDPVPLDTVTGWGTNTLTVHFAVPLDIDGQYSVVLRATSTIKDEALNALNGGSDEVDSFIFDASDPVVGVDYRGTNDTTPELTGAINEALADVAVTVNGVGYAATNDGDGTWTLPDGTIAGALAPGRYEVEVTATDPAGHTGSDSTSNELVITSPDTVLALEWNAALGVEEIKRIDTDTGAAEKIGEVGDLRWWHGQSVYNEALDRLYVVGWPAGGPYKLYTIDTTTGDLVGQAALSRTELFLAGLDSGAQLIALAWNYTDQTQDVLRIDPDTAGVTKLGTLGDLEWWQGQSVRSVLDADTLYVVGWPAGGPEKLYRFDLAGGAVTAQAELGRADLILCGADSSGDLIGCSWNAEAGVEEVFRIDPATGGVTQLGEIPHLQWWYGSGSVEPGSDLLYVAGLQANGSARLFTLDLSTGQLLRRPDMAGNTGGVIMTQSVLPPGATASADAIRIEEVSAPAPSVIVDDGDAGFAVAGTWTFTSGIPAFGGDHFYSAPGDGTSVARWTFTGLTPGATFRISATWIAKWNRATDAPFRILDGAAELATVDVNQQNAPDDFSASGASWENLGAFAITGDTLVIELSNDADGYVIADAIRIEQL